MRFHCYWLATIAILTGACALPQSVSAESYLLEQKAEVFRTPEGQDYAALSVRLQPGQRQAAQPEQVLLLIDTSASQVGEYRQQALSLSARILETLSANSPLVDVWAIDVEQTSLLSGLTRLDAGKTASVNKTLSQRLPAGATDLPAALEAALASLDAEKSATIIYLGDGFSAANLISSEKMASLVDQLSTRKVPVVSFVIGAQTDMQLLGILALRSGGVVLKEQPGQTVNQAAADVVNATRAAVWYPQNIQVSQGVRVLPEVALPVRSDRETIYLSEIQTSAVNPSLVLSDSVHQAQASFQLQAGVEHSALRALWLRAEQDAGLSVPTAGTVVLDTAKEVFEQHVAALLDQANAAANQGFAEQSLKISQALLQLDPRNTAAAKLLQVQQVVLLQGDRDIPPIVSELNELEGTVPPTDLELDRIERYKNLSKVAGERLALQVTNAINEARQLTERDPDVALSVLKGIQSTVRSASDIDPEVRRELDRRVGNVILQVRARREQIQNRRVRMEQQMAELEARRRLTEDLRLEEERLEQLIDQVRALLNDGFHGDSAAYAEAVAVAQAAVDLAPFSGVANVARFTAIAAQRLEETRYLRDLRAAGFLETLYQVELSHVPFPDEPPIRWPSAPVWKALTERRKIWASVDLKDDSPAERRIRAALDEETELQFVDTPLRDALDIIGEYHNITIFTDDIALEDAGVSTDEPVTMFISGVRLRSALKIMLERLPEPLTWVIEDEVMKITTTLVADEITETRVYPVADLVIPIQTLGGGAMGGGGLVGGANGMGGGGMGGGMGGGGMGGGGFGGGGGFFSIPAADVLPVGKKKP